MGTATLPSEEKIGVEFEDISQLRCKPCDSAIPIENVKASSNPRTGIRTIHAYCEHCNRLYKVTRALCGMGYRNRSIEIVNDAREKEKFLRMVAPVRGESYPNPLPPLQRRRASDTPVQDEASQEQPEFAEAR